MPSDVWSLFSFASVGSAQDTLLSEGEELEDGPVTLLSQDLLSSQQTTLPTGLTPESAVAQARPR